MKYKRKIIGLILAVLFCFTALWGCLENFSFAEDPTFYGDVDGNGKVDLKDTQLILRAALGIDQLEGAAWQAADVNGDTYVTLKDAVLVLKRMLQMIVSFPVEEANQPEEKPDQPEQNAKILVAYFSRTGTTRTMAEQISQETGGTLFEIEPVNLYPDSYQETVEIVRKEQAENARPPILNQVDNMQEYNVVFVGFPIWFGDEPLIIRTFLESYDFSGKVVIPFCTSGGSSLGVAQEHIEKLLPNVTVLKGLGLTGMPASSREDMKNWLAECKRQITDNFGTNTEVSTKPDNSGTDTEPTTNPDHIGMNTEVPSQPSDSEENTDTSENQKAEVNTMKIQAGQTIFTAEFANNSSAEAFQELLAKGQLTIEMSDYGNFEKVGPIGTILPRNDEYITTEPGDIILYQGNSLTIYYDKNSWNFTRIGKIQNVTQKELKNVLGSGDITVTFSLN